jgi:hypothetical protein
MVMLPKPVVPLVPVTVKDSVVEDVAVSVAILMSDICELVMLPLIARLTVEPVDVVAWTVVGVGVGVVVGVTAGFGVGVDVIGIGVGVAAGTEVGVAVAVGIGVGVAVGIGVGVAVGIGVGVAVGTGVGVAVGEGVGVGKGFTCEASTWPEIIPEALVTKAKLMVVTWLTVTDAPVCCCDTYPVAVTLTV